MDSLGGHPKVLLDEVEGHCQGNQGDKKSWSDGGNDSDGWQTEQRGSRQRLQRWRNMLGEKETMNSDLVRSVYRWQYKNTTAPLQIFGWYLKCWLCGYSVTDLCSTYLVYDVGISWESVKDLPQGGDVKEPEKRGNKYLLKYLKHTFSFSCSDI